MLGKPIMPTGMIPKTGAIINIKYSKKFRIKITFNSGQVIENDNIETLNQYTTLDEDEIAPEDIFSVEVFYPYSLLKNGVELLDFPGINAQDNEDNIVKNQILQIDLVIQVLSANQPFSLIEQENLQKWLIDKEVKSIIFVVNWMNKTETQKDRNKVLARIKKISDRFDTDLPKGLSKVYKVDALPAFKARQIKKFFKVHKSGLINFEAALQTIIEIRRKEVYKSRFPRIVRIANQIDLILQQQQETLNQEIFLLEEKRNAEITRGKTKESLFREEFNHHITTFRNWLSLSNLTTCYQDSLAIALQNSNFSSWTDENLEKAVSIYQSNIEQIIKEVCQEFSKKQSSSLSISFPNPPSISLPTRGDRTFGQSFRDIFNGNANKKRLDAEYEKNKWQTYKNAAQNYLSKFSQKALDNLNQYEKNSLSLMVFPIPSESNILKRKRQDLDILNSTSETINSISLSKNKRYLINQLERIKVFFLFWKNWLFYCFL